MKLSRTQKKTLRRSFMVILALLFMAEAWLWDKTGALVAWTIRQLPLDELKAQIVRFIDALSPIRTVALFIIPFLVLLPIKFAALWFLAHGSFFGGVSMIIIAKLAGLGVSSYLFTLCKPKLMQLAWMRWTYGHVVHWRARAAALLRPYTSFVHRYRNRLLRRFPRSKLLAMLRKRVQKARQSP